MRIGVPKEIKQAEQRVGMTPGSVREAVAHGHHVVVETNAGVGIGAEDYERAHDAPAATRWPAKSSSSAVTWSAWTETRRRAVPGGTVGVRMARTSNPAACNRSATATARASSPISTGTM